MSDRYFDKTNAIDKIINEGATSGNAEKLATLTKEDNLYAYALKHLDTRDWLPYIKDKGFFESPPKPIRSKGHIQFPWWEGSQYLLRVVEYAPQQVLDIALTLPATDNVRIHEDFAQAACRMPPNLAAQWAQKEIEWIKSTGVLYLNLSLYLGELVAYLASKSGTETALQLAQSLLDLQPDPDYEKKLEEEKKESEESEFYLPYTPEPRAKFDRWDYEEILKNHIPPLVEAGQLDTFKWLCNLLAKANDYSLRKDEEGRPKDFSYIWRPAIEDSDQNMKHDVRDALVESVRDAAEQLIEQDSDKLMPILEILNNTKYQQWSIFRRIALHLVRVEPSVEPTVVKHYLRNRDLFEDYHLHHEYQLLVRDRFGELAKPDRDEIIGWVLAGEQDRIKRVKDWYQEEEQRKPSPQELDKGVNIWLRDELAQFAQYLRGNLKGRYNAAVQSVGEADHPEFPSYSTSWVGPTSPKTSKELSEWSVQALLDYLRTWQPSGESMSDSRDGLADAIANAVGEQPEKYAEHCNQFYQLHPQLHPKYIRGFIEGFHQAARDDKAFPWHPVLELCSWVVRQKRDFVPDIIAQAKGDDREEANWGWTRKRIANLLEEGLKKDREVTIAFDQKDRVWSIIKILTGDPDPTFREEREKLQPFDAATMSINTVRGEAMHAVMYFIMWVREIHKKQNGGEDLSKGLDLVPDTRKVLEARLDRRRENTLTIRSVYGRWYPFLVAWDENWAKSNKRKIFPPRFKTQKHWDVAWGTSVVYNRPYDNVFRVLRNDYRKALNRLGKINVDLAGARPPDESLAQHILTFYWRGLIKRRSGSLIDHFFEVAKLELRGHAMGFIGQSLADTAGPVPPEIMDRFKKLWIWRLKSAKSSDQLSDYDSELVSFGKWFASGKLEPDWAIEQLVAVLRLIGRIDADEKMVEQLAALAERSPKEVIECFRLMVEGESDGYKVWLWKGPDKELLRKVIDGEDQEAREAAIDLVHRLGAMGHMEFRDLLQH